MKPTFIVAKTIAFWRTLFPRTIREHEQIYCSICDGRIWFWQSATRLYELGMTRAHVNPCAANFLADKLESEHAAFLRMQRNVEETRKNLIKRNTRTIH